jgi:hypothetical protein
MGLIFVLRRACVHIPKAGFFDSWRAQKANKQEGLAAIWNLGIDLKYRLICGRKMQLLLQIKRGKF